MPEAYRCHWSSLSPVIERQTLVFRSAVSRHSRPRSHSRTVRSLLALARVRPLGLNATPVTVLVWPVSGPPRGRRERKSHSRTVASALALALALARVRPLGLNATPV